ncbi:hypothetical protein WHR41_05288 [Cladosporium halotolerans]|uniref:cutinase n=1 Tax=Cladosporium halotolerans TaxID=1052096 RepID=A0AB34KT21_9PEZI
MQYTATLSYLLYAASIALAAPVEKRQFSGFSGLGGGGGSSTRNDIVDGKCAPVTFIFARGSTEPGNMGSSVGPAIASALTDSLGDDGVAIQGVDYEATIASNANMGREGGPVMAKLVSQTKSNCPDSKIALGGYSQGGFVVSNAISSAGVNPDDIAAAVVYGDPSRQAAGGLDASKVKDYCVSGDGVCSGTFAITAAHLAYTSNGDTEDGAKFIISKTQGGSGTSSGGSSSSSGSSDATSSSAPATTSAASSSGSSSGLGSFGGLGGSSGSSGLGNFGGSSGSGSSWLSGLTNRGSTGGSGSSWLSGLSGLSGSGSSGSSGSSFF